MGKNIIGIFVVVILVATGFFFYKNRNLDKNITLPTIVPIINPSNNASDNSKEALDESGLGLTIPKGYKISIFAKGLGDARDLELDPNGTLLVSVPSQGKIVALPNGNPQTVANDLSRPHGIAFKNGKLYVAQLTSVDVFDYDSKTLKVSGKRKIADIPDNAGGHITRSLVFNKEGKLLISIGSSCNACIEKDSRRGAILIANDDGSNLKTYATGLRNSVFMTKNSKTGDVWATDMGRDNLGDDTPNDEVNIIKEGGMYGWPFCYNDQIVDTQLNKGGSTFNCSTSISPHLKFQAHSAPLGLAFLGNDLLVSFHGSWNRTVPTGYKVIRVKLDSQGNQISQEDFITGWIKGSVVTGRPVDVLIDKNGKIYVSDDKLGVVYLIEEQK